MKVILIFILLSFFSCAPPPLVSSTQETIAIYEYLDGKDRYRYSHKDDLKNSKGDWSGSGSIKFYGLKDKVGGTFGLEQFKSKKKIGNPYHRHAGNCREFCKKKYYKWGGLFGSGDEWELNYNDWNTIYVFKDKRPGTTKFFSRNYRLSADGKSYPDFYAYTPKSVKSYLLNYFLNDTSKIKQIDNSSKIKNEINEKLANLNSFIENTPDKTIELDEQIVFTKHTSWDEILSYYGGYEEAGKSGLTEQDTSSLKIVGMMDEIKLIGPGKFKTTIEYASYNEIARMIHNIPSEFEFIGTFSIDRFDIESIKNQSFPIAKFSIENGDYLNKKINFNIPIERILDNPDDFKEILLDNYLEVSMIFYELISDEDFILKYLTRF